MRPLPIVLAVATCASTPRTTLPPLPPEATTALRRGDMIELRVDPSVDGIYRIDPRGEIDLPYCGPTAIADLTQQAADAVIARCLVAAGALRDPGTHLTRVVHRAAGITIHFPHSDEHCELPYQPGIRISHALSYVALSDRGLTTRRVLLRRDAVTVTIDIDEISFGERGDEPLAPDDEITVPRGRATTCPSRPAPPMTTRPSALPPAPPTGSTCGELVLAHAEREAFGLGAKHVELVAIEAAMASTCTPASLAASLPRACLEAAMRREELAQSHGPRHPEMLALAAALALCSP